MPLFKAPSVVMQKTRNSAWNEKTSGKPLGDARKLWGDYWLRFNTMQIPMLGEDEYFKTAAAIAEVAADEEEFGKLFVERSKQRQKELSTLVAKIGTTIVFNDDIFPCEAAENTALNICRTGCFEYFVSLLKGNVLGWEADKAGDDMPNNTIAHFVEETKKPNNEEAQKPDNKEAQKQDGEEMQDSIDDEGSIDYENSTHYVGSFSPLSPSCETQYYDEYDYYYAMDDMEDLQEPDRSRRGSREEKGYRETRAGDIQEISSSDEDDMSHRERGRRLLKSSAGHISATTASPNSSSKKQTTRGNSRKRVRFHDDDDDCEHKRQGTQIPVPTLSNDAPSTQQSAVEISRKSSRKRRRSDGDENGDEDGVEISVNHGCKRQRTQSPAPAAPPVASSVRQPAVANTKKRSRTNDGDDDDDDADDDADKGNQGRKRQKMESTASDPTPAVSSTQKAADANVAKKRRRVNGVRKPRGRNSASGTLNTASTQPLRRSARRNNKSTLQELDGSGKPRPIR
ncbi:hypothetical protein V8C34DRAFT_300920 [Trichoderma compactum]